jgi:hypothetical protein
VPAAIDHLALVVRDPARTARLCAAVFADARATRNGEHIAFAMDKAEQRACAARLHALGIDHQLARHDTALYFADYDNHTFELDVTAIP